MPAREHRTGHQPRPSLAARAADEAIAPRFARSLRLLIVLSGAVALGYQSLWIRHLALILGSTTYAVGTVLAAFMAGLGVGAWALGRRADASPAPLRLYAALELAIGAAGLASPFVLAQGNAAYGIAYTWLRGSPWLLTLARFLIGFAFVTVPAFLMGGTLPVATRYVVRSAAQVGREIGLLYALNTAGAAAGVLLVPFVLLPWLGMRVTLLASGATNVVIALVAWSAASRESTAEPIPAPARHDAHAPAPRDRRVLAAFFLSGFVAIALEVAWNRFFSMYVGSSIYSYAVILFLYLVGITLGGLLFTVLDRRGVDPTRLFVAALALLVADLALTIPLMDRVLYLQLATLAAVGVGFWPFQLASVAAPGLVVLPPTILFGISFPAIAKRISPTAERVGARLGLAYLVNTAGTTAGALAASFVLLPHLGLRTSLVLLTGLAALAAALAAGRGAWASPRGRAAAAAIGTLALIPVLVPAWDARLMHTAISKEAEPLVAAWRENRLARELETMTMLEVRDGVDATASVVEYGGGARALFVNGKPDASNTVDMLTQAMIGHLPLLVQPAAREVLVIGMGSGVTVGAVARHPVESIEVVEISPEVLDLGTRWFAAENRDVVHDPRLVIHLEDGRNFVAFNQDRLWDVIISEPSNPWMTGAASLFTDEFFTQARRRLRPDGILAQWFHVYSMAIDDVRVLLATLHRHFEHVHVFTFFEADQRGDMVVLAANRPLDFTPVLAALRGRGPAGDDFREFRFDATRLLQSFVLARENLDAFVGGAAVNSDDHPVIELDAPRSVFQDTVRPNLEALHRASGGARLPLAGADELAAGFRIEPPSGFHRTFSGFRNQLLPAPSPGARPLRGIATDVEFEDGGGRRLEVLGERGESDAGKLAALAAGGPATAVGDATVDDHPATVYALADGAVAVAWTCPDSEFSYAATLRGAADRDAAVAALTTAGLRCHAGDEPAP